VGGIASIGREADAILGPDNAIRAMKRERYERVFLVVKRSWGFTKGRYVLAKNTGRADAASALANMYLVGHELRPQGTQGRRERRRRG